jgi:hypothetical protein
MWFLYRSVAARNSSSEPPSFFWPYAQLLAPAVVFALVAVMQASQYSAQLDAARTRVEQRPGPCVPREGLFDGTRTSFDDEFGTFEYEYLATSSTSTVDRVVLERDRCATLCLNRDPAVRGYFRLQPATPGSPACTIGESLD